jgi:hypothetical protein
MGKTDAGAGKSGHSQHQGNKPPLGFDTSLLRCELEKTPSSLLKE